MSAIWLLVLATGVTPFQPGDLSTAQPATAVAATQPAAMALSPAAAVVDPAARSPQQLRDAVTAALKKINGAKGADRAAAITTMTDLYSEISRDRQLTQPERQLARPIATRSQPARRSCDTSWHTPARLRGRIRQFLARQVRKQACLPLRKWRWRKPARRGDRRPKGSINWSI